LPLVIYMGVARLRGDPAGAGRRRDARVDAGGRGVEREPPRQRTLLTRLGDLARDLRAANIGSPAILLVGEIAAAARQPASDGTAPAASAAR
jgi:siroheme synthase